MTAESIKPVKIDVPISWWMRRFANGSRKVRQGRSVWPWRKVRSPLIQGNSFWLLRIWRRTLMRRLLQQPMPVRRNCPSNLSEPPCRTGIQHLRRGLLQSLLVHDNRYIETLLVNPSTFDGAYLYGG